MENKGFEKAAGRMKMMAWAKEHGVTPMTVMQRVNDTKQPRGGYIDPSDMDEVAFDDGKALAEQESVHPSTTGMAVDYLARLMVTKDAEDAFKISRLGAEACNRIEEFEALLSQVKGLDDASIQAACKITWFDGVYRAGYEAPGGPEAEQADEATCGNIRTMVERSMSFFESFGPVVMDGPTFEGAYTPYIMKGDGDFATEDTLWDFKVSKYPPTNKHTLQLAIYYHMGLRSVHPELQRLTRIGVFNPRLNSAYIYDMCKMDDERKKEIEDEVIGFGWQEE